MLKCLLGVVEPTFMQGKDDALLHASIVLMVKQLICTQYLRVRFLLEAQYSGENWYSIQSHKLDSVGSIPTSATKLLYMEGIEKTKMTRAKKTNGSEVHQIMTALTDTTLRGIVRSANEEGIKREDIVSLLKENGQFVLIYFR